ncbi:MAG: deoxyhypusine synthase [Dehalococcoidia bacterium]|nr:deoxyhypusine synthase [Dehalococcoidia bacterium]
MTDLFAQAVHPFSIEDRLSAAQLVERLGKTSFQARNIGTATDIWARMLADEVTIFFGLAGAMVPAGMRKVVSYLVENRLVDCIVSTGANLYHDVYETLGAPHWKSHPQSDDVLLGRVRANRFYDVVAPEDDFFTGQQFVTEFSQTLESDRPYTTREFLYLLGRALTVPAKEEGILTTAARAGVPVFCPAIGDSAIGIGITESRAATGHRLIFDVIGDVLEISHLASRSAGTGVIYIGGGTPKNFIQQAEVTTYVFGRELEGHKYGIQMTMDNPQWGGLSGCTFEEAQSWRKIAPDANTVTVNVEASLALPLVVSALAEGSAEAIRNRRRPALSFEAVSGL